MNFDRRDDVPEHMLVPQMINEHQVIVLSGETGCGKTTQVPQYIMDSARAESPDRYCHIVCTQPRRISAISVAARVAEERGERVGQRIGHQVRPSVLLIDILSFSAEKY